MELDEWEMKAQRHKDHCLAEAHYLEDKQPVLAHALLSTIPALRKALEDKKVLMEELDSIYSNGCFTGECPHDKQSDCDRAVVSFMSKAYQEGAALENVKK